MAALGLGAILQTSTMFFTVMKYLGAAYLVYLGIKAFKAPPVELGRSGQAGR
jgi:homoserine/homoserine lactone efflux protein